MVLKSTRVNTLGSSSSRDNILRDPTAASNECFNSLEQFLTPIQIQKNHPAAASLPGFRKPSVTGEDGPFGGAVGPTVHNLDPYFPLDNYEAGDDGSKFFEKNDFIAVYSDAVDTNGNPQLSLDSYVVADQGNKKNINTVRISALRGPLILSGWGYGSDDMPQPSKGAAWPENAQFSPETAGDRTKWKTGPVHLMWDDERQVWHGGPRIVCGVVIGSVPTGDICNPTTFSVKLLRNTGNGHKLTQDLDEIITVKNRDPSLEQGAVTNQIFCIAIKINYEWLPLWVGCPVYPACGGQYQPPVPPCLDSQC